MSAALLDGDEDVLILLGILTAQVPDLPCGRLDSDRVGVVLVVRLAHEHRLKPGKVWLALATSSATQTPTGNGGVPGTAIAAVRSSAGL